MEIVKFTHTYENVLGKHLKCFIWDPGEKELAYKLRTLPDFYVWIKNENGVGVYLKYSKLTKITFLKRGLELIAIDPCKMNMGETCLTVNKIYKIVSTTDGGRRFSVIDDDHDEHWFDTDTLEEFFIKHNSAASINK